jgi:hypothetical protein
MIFALTILGDLVAVAIITRLLCRVRGLSSGWIGVIAGTSYALISIAVELSQGCFFDLGESMCGLLMGGMNLPVVLFIGSVAPGIATIPGVIILVCIDAFIGYLLVGQLLLEKLLKRTVV